MRPRCARDAFEMRPRCARDAPEMHSRCARYARLTTQGSRGGLMRGSSVRWGNLQMEKPLRTLGREEETNALREGIDGVSTAQKCAPDRARLQSHHLSLGRARWC